MFSHEETDRYLASLTDHEKSGFTGPKPRFDLDKLRTAVSSMGRPDRSYRSIHVAGTKGKGSVCAYISSILKSSGYSTGMFTSPHLFSPAERIRVDGEMITEDELAEGVDTVRRHIGRDERDYTFFEIYTLLAIWFFHVRKVDVAVFETGLGGRLDATNILEPEICCITPVSYDHTHILGDSLSEIASEKAAIIKRGTVCVSSPQDPAVMEVISRRCRETGSELLTVGSQIICNNKASDIEGSVFDVVSERKYENLHTVMPGIFQPVNCAAAVGVCERFVGPDDIDTDDLREGVAKAFIPGRMEVIATEPLLIIDGAQNAASAACLRESVKTVVDGRKKIILVIGLSGDKDIKGFCREIVPVSEDIVVTRSRTRRAADPDIVRGFVRGKRTYVTRDTEEALGTAFRLAGSNGVILVTGSFYLIAEVREALLHGKDRERVRS